MSLAQLGNKFSFVVIAFRIIGREDDDEEAVDNDDDDDDEADWCIIDAARSTGRSIGGKGPEDINMNTRSKNAPAVIAFVNCDAFIDVVVAIGLVYLSRV